MLAAYWAIDVKPYIAIGKPAYVAVDVCRHQGKLAKVDQSLQKIEKFTTASRQSCIGGLSACFLRLGSAQQFDIGIAARSAAVQTVMEFR